MTFGRLHVLEEDKEYRIKNNIKAHHCYWKCKCECGGIISVLGNSLLSGATTSCGCLISKGEEKIRELLIKNNIPFETQKTFPNCISNTGTRFRFDFYIKDSFLLEFDGEQHFKYKEKGLFTKNKYLKICTNDKQKTQWCKEQKIPLKRIPYWEINNITIENILDNTFLVKEN